MQWNTTFADLFATCDFSTIQATRTHNFDTLGTCFLCVLHSFLHCTLKGYTTFNLLCNVLRNQLRIQVRTANFVDVYDNLVIFNQFLDIVTQCFDIGTVLTNNHTRTRGMNSHDNLFGKAFNNNLGQTGFL